MLSIKTLNNYYTNYKNNYFEKTGKKNPYKKNTFEYFIVEYVLNNVSRVRASLLSENDGEMLEYLVNQKLDISFEDIYWGWHNIFEYGITLCRLNELLKLKTIKKHDRPRFAVFLEEGLLNISEQKSFTNQLEKMKNKKRLNDLKLILRSSQIIKQRLGLVRAEISRNDSKDENIITIKHHNPYESCNGNRSVNTLYNIRDIYIPVSSWSHPNESWVSIETRGIFHHIGDEMGFIMAAVQYGDCYIVGKEECGDLIVLNDISRIGVSDGYSYLQKVSAMDFDYIYGVPKGEGYFPEINNKTKVYDNCAKNTQKNSDMVTNYWYNDVFLKYAGRKTDVLTVKELTTQIYDKCLENIKKHRKLAPKNSTAEKLYQTIEDFCENVTDKTYIVNKEYLEKTRLEIYSLAYKVEYKTAEGKTNTLEKSIFAKIDSEIRDNCTFFYKTVAHKIKCDIINPKETTRMNFFHKQGKNKPNHEKVLSFITIILDYLDLMKALLTADKQNQNNQPNSIQSNNGLFDENSYVSDNDYTLNNKDINNKFFIFFCYKFIDMIASDEYSKYANFLRLWFRQNTKALFVSEIIDMNYEYRMFVINNKVVATSPCYRNTTPFNAWQGGIFDPRLCEGHDANKLINNKNTRLLVSRYAKFAKKFNNEIKNKYPNLQNYVLDVCYNRDNDTIVPIELNSITWAGAYQINMNRVCAAIAGVKYKKEQDSRNKDFSIWKVKELAGNEFFNAQYNQQNKTKL